MHKTMNDHHVTLAESCAGKRSKHQPEPQEANAQTAETDQGRCNAIQGESHGLRRNPPHGETPPAQERPRAKDG